VIKLDLINEVVTKTGVTKTKAEMAVETVFESMKKALATGDRIELRGFGVFTVRPRKTGIGRNPRTGAEVNIPPGIAVTRGCQSTSFIATLGYCVAPLQPARTQVQATSVPRSK
jgi:DNA-binding protein HU-beta